MSAGLLHAFAGVALATLGLYAFVTLRHLLRRLLAINILGSGVFLITVGLAQRDGTVDPLPQALVLTGIVIAVAATALALVLIRRLYADTGRTDLESEPRPEPEPETSTGTAEPAEPADPQSAPRSDGSEGATNGDDGNSGSGNSRTQAPAP